MSIDCERQPQLPLRASSTESRVPSLTQVSDQRPEPVSGSNIIRSAAMTSIPTASGHESGDMDSTARISCTSTTSTTSSSCRRRSDCWRLRPSIRLMLTCLLSFAILNVCVISAVAGRPSASHPPHDPSVSLRPPQLTDPRGRIQYKTTYACEGKQLDLGCEEGKLIHLVRANYGRFSLSICNPTGHLDLSVNCMSFRSFLIMQDKCSQSSNCSVVVSSKLFGDPCPGTSKYLEVQYHCVHPSAVGTGPEAPTILTSGSGIGAASTRKPDAVRDFMDYIEPKPSPAVSTSSASSSPSSSSGSEQDMGSNDLTGMRPPYETTSPNNRMNLSSSTPSSSVLLPISVPTSSSSSAGSSGHRVSSVSSSSSLSRHRNPDTMRILQSMMTSAPSLESRRTAGSPHLQHNNNPQSQSSHHPHQSHRPALTQSEILKAMAAGSANQPIPPRPELSLPAWLEPSVVNPTAGSGDSSSRSPGSSPNDPGIDVYGPEKDSSASDVSDQTSSPNQSEVEDDDMVMMAVALFFIVFFAVMSAFGLIYWMFKSENTRVRKFVRSIPMIHCILGPDPDLDMDSEKVSSVVQSSAYGTTTTMSAGFPIVQTRIPTQITSMDSSGGGFSGGNISMTLSRQYHQQQQLLQHHQRQQDHHLMHASTGSMVQQSSAYGTTSGSGFPVLTNRTHVSNMESVGNNKNMIINHQFHHQQQLLNQQHISHQSLHPQTMHLQARQHPPLPQQPQSLQQQHQEQLMRYSDACTKSRRGIALV